MQCSTLDCCQKQEARGTAACAAAVGNSSASYWGRLDSPDKDKDKASSSNAYVNDLAKHHMLAVQVRGGDSGDEELAAISVGPRVCHG